MIEISSCLVGCSCFCCRRSDNSVVDLRQMLKRFMASMIFMLPSSWFVPSRSFTLFSKLPTELQLEVWEYAADDWAHHLWVFLQLRCSRYGIDSELVQTGYLECSLFRACHLSKWVVFQLLRSVGVRQYKAAYKVGGRFVKRKNSIVRWLYLFRSFLAAKKWGIFPSRLSLRRRGYPFSYLSEA